MMTDPLSAYIESNLEFIAEHPTAIRAVIEISANARTDDGAPLVPMGDIDDPVARLAAMFRDGQQAGEFRTFDRDSGVPLVQAVAASCAVPGVYPPVTIDGRRYVDGGMRSAANADLADGYERLVVLAPIARGVGPLASVDAQVSGMVARVAVVSPDEASRRAIGRNVLDPAARRPSAEAGRAPVRSSRMAAA